MELSYLIIKKYLRPVLKYGPPYERSQKPEKVVRWQNFKMNA
jgi:hypothetical protein